MKKLSLLAIVSILASCGGDDVEPLSVQFAATFGPDAPYVCGAEYNGVGSSDSTFTASGLRVYIHGVELRKSDGTYTAVELDNDGMWQDGTVALLDFEDGSGTCADAGSPETNFQITGIADTSDVTGLRFTLGVPFDANHQDAALAQAPLNLTSMFWNWQGGYKFLRAEGSTAGLPAWRFHLGSTGCDGDVTGGVTACSNQNRPVVEIDYQVGQRVVLNVRELLANIDLESNMMETPPGCMSAPVDADCAPYFTNLGLPFGGASAGESTVFSAE